MRKQNNMLSVDLEDWYHSGYLKDYANKKNRTPRIVETTKKILKVFEENKVKATFFILGEIAEKEPELIKKIALAGHELAIHGYTHTPLWEHTTETFRQELRKTNNIIQQITGKKSIGYRAPYASLDQSTAWAIDILTEENFKYDSSIFPMRTPLYGVKGAPLKPYKISSKNILKPDENARILEIPFTIYRTPLIDIPCTGAIYGRFLPFWLLSFFLKSIKRSRPINFYFHPWEIDRDIPNLRMPLKNKIISYYKTNDYLTKIQKTLKSIKFSRIDQYLTANFN